MKQILQKLKDSLGFETYWSGMLGIVAVIATVIEMLLNGISAASIAAAVKDVAGTLAVILVMLIAVKQLVHKEPANFDEAFPDEMENISIRYAPLVQKQTDSGHRYLIASQLSAINDLTPGAYHKFFDLTNPTELEVSISKTVFVGVGGSDELFRNIKAKLISNLQQKSTAYSIITRCEASTAGIRLLFSEPLATAAHAKELAAFIDCILLTYVTEYKRT